MKRITAILFFLQIAASVSSQADSSRFAIIPFSDAYDGWMFKIKESKPAELSKEDINTIESILKTCIADYNLKQKRKINLAGYKKQFMAVVNKDGEREVWVNCFCDNFVSDSDWKREVIFVKDGGDCFFHVKMNLKTKKYYSFDVNGMG